MKTEKKKFKFGDKVMLDKTKAIWWGQTKHKEQIIILKNRNTNLEITRSGTLDYKYKVSLDINYVDVSELKRGWKK